MRLFLLLAGIILLAGCAAPEAPENETPVEPPPEPPPAPPEEEMTCEEYCPTLPHIQCVGTWDISGTYPDCVCSFECEVGEENVTEEEPEEPEDLEELVEPSNKTLSQMLDEGLEKTRTQFYKENEGTFSETMYTWKRILGQEAVPGAITFDLAPINDVKFDGKGIEEIQAAGFLVFEQEDYATKAYGIAIFLGQMTVLDTYTGTDAFDVEYFHSVEHRHMNDCWVYSKDLSRNMNSEWVSTYFMRCETVFAEE